MPTDDLRVSERNALYTEIQKNGLDRLEFTVMPLSSAFHSYVFRLKHEPTSFVFGMAKSVHPFNPYYVDSYPRFGAGSDSNGPFDWDDTVEAFSRWLQRIREEQAHTRVSELIDLWSVAAAGSPSAGLVSRTSAGENTPFSEEEKVRLRTELAEFGRVLHSSNEFTAEQSVLVSSSISDLATKLDQYSRRDWYGMFISSIFGLVIDRVLSTQAANDAMREGLRLFGWVMRHGLKLLGN